MEILVPKARLEPTVKLGDIVYMKDVAQYYFINTGTGGAVVLSSILGSGFYDSYDNLKEFEKSKRTDEYILYSQEEYKMSLQLK